MLQLMPKSGELPRLFLALAVLGFVCAKKQCHETQPQSECGGNEPKKYWHYMKPLQECVPVTACGLIKDRYNSKKECENDCGPPAYCFHKFWNKYCNQTSKIFWYYDAVLRTCIKTRNGICEQTGNDFQTWRQCWTTCRLP